MSIPTETPGVCRECGARNAAGTSRCWLCGAELKWAAPSPEQPISADPQAIEARSQAYYRVPAIPAEFADVELVPERPNASRFSYSLTTIFAAMTIMAIAAGFFRDSDEAGFGILVLLVGLPALLITAIRMSRLRAKGGDVTWTNRLVTFFLSSLAVAAAIVLLALAAILALFIYCLVVCSKGGRLF